MFLIILHINNDTLLNFFNNLYIDRLELLYYFLKDFIILGKNNSSNYYTSNKKKVYYLIQNYFQNTHLNISTNILSSIIQLAQYFPFDKNLKILSFVIQDSEFINSIKFFFKNLKIFSKLFSKYF